MGHVLHVWEATYSHQDKRGNNKLLIMSLLELSEFLMALSVLLNAVRLIFLSID